MKSNANSKSVVKGVRETGQGQVVDSKGFVLDLNPSMRTNEDLVSLP